MCTPRYLTLEQGKNSVAILKVSGLGERVRGSSCVFEWFGVSPCDVIQAKTLFTSS